MVQLKFIDLPLPSAELGEESCLPPLSVRIGGKLSGKVRLEEDDGLFIGYGAVDYVYPYRYLDNYGRALSPKSHRAVVLENEYLKATFLPAFGGKLWSLFDKAEEKELLFTNTVVCPCNLATRNAWMSGGIEWNAGSVGHHPYTCSLLHTAEAHLDDGTPVFRFYYFERIRCAVVQMDFFLPKNSRVLYGRMRITNPHDTVLPMYWWSNAAVSYGSGDRVIVPAAKAYTVCGAQVDKIDIPMRKRINISYPHRNLFANDFFFKTIAAARASPREGGVALSA